MDTTIVDADGHVLEPKDLWREYVEPEYRDRALRIEADAQGLEHWVIDGRPFRYRYGVFGDMGSVGQPDLEPYFTPGKITYEEGIALSPGGWDPHERVKVLDREGIDRVLLYPSLGITWEGGCPDAVLATACTRAYNRWLSDYCAACPARLVPIAHVSLADPRAGAAELERAVKAGHRGAMLRAYPSGDRPYGHPDNDPFWAAAQDLEVPVALHIGGNTRLTGHELFDIEFGPGTWWIYMMFAADVQTGLTSLFQGAVPERFPRLKFALLESGCGWIANWLHRMDEVWEHMGFSTALRRPPSEYFREQFLITMEPDETLATDMVRHVGAQSLMWASDYPHSDASPDSVTTVKRTLAPLSDAERCMVLGENALRAYRLG